jgi:hypothetical protein
MFSERESARDRATRKWHNASVKRSVDDEPRTTISEKPSKQRMAILGIFKEQSEQTIIYYSMIIHRRHKILLKEKLRRLRAEQHNE